MKKVIVSLTVFFLIFLSFSFYLRENYTTPIITYHSLDGKKLGSYAVVTRDSFLKQMEFIKKGGYEVIALERYCQLLKDKEKIPQKAVIITFDDGYKDNLAAMEILRDFGFPATLFLIVNNIGKGGFLTRDDLDWILANTKVKIGSHTLNHIYLPEADAAKVRREIRGSKDKLEKLFSVKVGAISYPVGGFDRRVLKEVKEAGYRCALTTNRGFSRDLDLYALRRIKITNRDSKISLWAKLSGFYNLFRKPKSPN